MGAGRVDVRAKQLIRKGARDVAAGLLHYSGGRRVMAAIRRKLLGGRRLLIVSYHRVVDDFAREVRRSIPGLLISRETFRGHLRSIHAAGFEFCTLEHALAVLSGQRSAKKDLCVLTFDDGYRDVYRNGFPILQSMGIPAIMYLPAALIGTSRRFDHDRLFHLIHTMIERGHQPIYDMLPPAAPVLLEPIFRRKMTISLSLDQFIEAYSSTVLKEVVDALKPQLGGGPDLDPEQGDILDWDEVRKMSSAGMDFGAHTLEHIVLTLEPPERVLHEIRGSKELIERQVGRRVTHFAFCNGWYSDEVIRALIENGFESAVTTEDYPNRIGDNPFTLKRKVLWENFSIGLLGKYSGALTACQVDDVFGMFRVNHPVPGRRLQRVQSKNASRDLLPAA